MDYGSQVAASHCYHIFYEGCLTNFEIGEEGEEASNLYPEVDYTRMDTYLKRYLWKIYVSERKIREFPSQGFKSSWMFV